MFLTIIKIIMIVVVTTFWSILAVITGPLNFGLPAYHLISTTWAKQLIWISGVKIEATGLENIDPEKNYVFISNHASLFDIPILLSIIKCEIKMVAKKELVYIPIFGWSLWAGRYILIDRNDMRKSFKAMKNAEKKLRKGTSILIFPEGTRSSDGEIQSFKKGGFYLALQTGFDILPVSISGSNTVMPKNKFRITPVKVHLVIGEPIAVKEYKRNKDEFIDSVRNVIISNLKEEIV
ncbi:MAG: 1-acyl-sn-glycerol-3-phosphate acyltransferase [Spirochaetota bacterium]|nr:1-acyl-sn-glycerol-3-phosphate acyltransferase [Spirochaetota bacterium]